MFIEPSRDVKCKLNRRSQPCNWEISGADKAGMQIPIRVYSNFFIGNAARSIANQFSLPVSRFPAVFFRCSLIRGEWKTDVTFSVLFAFPAIKCLHKNTSFGIFDDRGIYGPGREAVVSLAWGHDTRNLRTWCKF